MKIINRSIHLKFLLIITFFCSSTFLRASINIPEDTTDIQIVKKEVPTNFIPGIINKEFLEAVYLKANQMNVDSKNDILYSIGGKIDNLYLKDKKQIAIKTVSQQIYKGKLICVSKHGVYLYNENDLGLVFCNYKSIEWIRRGRSYGNWLWKTGIGLGLFFAYQFGEQSTEAVVQAFLAGAAATVTVGQIAVAPIYSLRLLYPTIKFPISGNLEKGIKYYKMVIGDVQSYSNAVDFNTFPGYMPSEN